MGHYAARIHLSAFSDEFCDRYRRCMYYWWNWRTIHWYAPADRLKNSKFKYLIVPRTRTHMRSLNASHFAYVSIRFNLLFGPFSECSTNCLAEATTSIDRACFGKTIVECQRWDLNYRIVIIGKVELRDRVCFSTHKMILVRGFSWNMSPLLHIFAYRGHKCVLLDVLSIFCVYSRMKGQFYRFSRIFWGNFWTCAKFFLLTRWHLVDLYRKLFVFQPKKFF